MRSPEEDQILRDVMQRLDSFPEAPTTQDLEEIGRLLDASRDIPLSDDEAVTVVGKLRAFPHDTESITFRHAAGRHLAEAREAAGFTRQQAADQVRLTEAELRMIEAGEQPLGLLEAARLANLYEISLDDLAEELL